VTTAALDRLLAGLIAAQLVTGLLSLRAGSPPTAPLFWLHGLLGCALLAAVILKLRRSLPGALAGRRWGKLAVASLLATLTLGALIGGIAWVASGRILAIGGWTVLTIHVILGLALIPIALLHLVPRRWRLLRPSRGSPSGRRISRRTLLGAAGLGVAGAAIWVTTNLLDTVQGGVRRFTGSRWLPDGGIPPPTTFFGEPAPPLEEDAWRLAVHGRVQRPLELGAIGLAELPRATSHAVLDCTAGWAMRTQWEGVSLGELLARARPLPGARGVTVRSATGWYCRMPLDEARDALLATHVAGQPLPRGNGAPCRLVAPDRRGLEWVKWVVEVEVG
jgi:hypothetical protein